MGRQGVQMERGGIMCPADLEAMRLSVQGPLGDSGQISAVIIILRGTPSPFSLQFVPRVHLRLHFSPRAKVRWPGEQRKVRGNTGQAPGRWLSLAILLDLLTHNFKFYSSSSFCPFFFLSCTVLFSQHCKTKQNLNRLSIL